MALVVHALIALALIAGYVVLKVTDNGGEELLGLLAGYIVGAGTQAGLQHAGAAPPP